MFSSILQRLLCEYFSAQTITLTPSFEDLLYRQTIGFNFASDHPHTIKEFLIFIDSEYVFDA